MTVYGTDCPVSEPSQSSSIWFSHNLTGIELWYEARVRIYDGTVFWIDKPYRCGPYTNMVIFWSELKSQLRKNKLLLGDQEYIDKN